MSSGEAAKEVLPAVAAAATAATATTASSRSSSSHKTIGKIRILQGQLMIPGRGEQQQHQPQLPSFCTANEGGTSVGRKNSAESLPKIVVRFQQSRSLVTSIKSPTATTTASGESRQQTDRGKMRMKVTGDDTTRPATGKRQTPPMLQAINAAPNTAHKRPGGETYEESSARDQPNVVEEITRPSVANNDSAKRQNVTKQTIGQTTVTWASVGAMKQQVPIISNANIIHDAGDARRLANTTNTVATTSTTTALVVRSAIVPEASMVPADVTITVTNKASTVATLPLANRVAIGQIPSGARILTQQTDKDGSMTLTTAQPSAGDLQQPQQQELQTTVVANADQQSAAAKNCTIGEESISDAQNSTIMLPDGEAKVSREVKLLKETQSQSKVLAEYIDDASRQGKLRKRRSISGTPTSSSSPLATTATGTTSTLVAAFRRRLQSRNSIGEEVSVVPSLSNKRTGMRSENAEFKMKQQKFLNDIHDKCDATDYSEGEESAPTPTPLANESFSSTRSDPSSTIGSSSSKQLKPSLVPMESSKPGNDRFCFRCRANKQDSLLGCGTCLRSFHKGCARVPHTDAPSWSCHECKLSAVAHQSNPFPTEGDVNLHDCLNFALENMLITAPEMNLLFNPLDKKTICSYDTIVTNHMDLTVISAKLREKKYLTTEDFVSDLQWIVHNMSLFEENSRMLSGAKALYKDGKQQMVNIETCRECYTHLNVKPETWFKEACSKPHLLVWAKLKGFPYWPGKLMNINGNNQADIRFFGDHDRAWVPVKDCFLFSKRDPNSKSTKRPNWGESLVEAEEHVGNIIARFGSFNYAPFQMLLEAGRTDELLREMVPNAFPEAGGSATPPKLTMKIVNSHGKMTALSSSTLINDCDELSTNSSKDERTTSPSLSVQHGPGELASKGLSKRRASKPSAKGTRDDAEDDDDHGGDSESKRLSKRRASKSSAKGTRDEDDDDHGGGSDRGKVASTHEESVSTVKKRKSVCLERLGSELQEQEHEGRIEALIIHRNSGNWATEPISKRRKSFLRARSSLNRNYVLSDTLHSSQEDLTNGNGQSSLTAATNQPANDEEDTESDKKSADEALFEGTLPEPNSPHFAIEEEPKIIMDDHANADNNTCSLSAGVTSAATSSAMAENVSRLTTAGSNSGSVEERSENDDVDMKQEEENLEVVIEATPTNDSVRRAPNDEPEAVNGPTNSSAPPATAAATLSATAGVAPSAAAAATTTENARVSLNVLDTNAAATALAAAVVSTHKTCTPERKVPRVANKNGPHSVTSAGTDGGCSTALERLFLPIPIKEETLEPEAVAAIATVLPASTSSSRPNLKQPIQEQTAAAAARSAELLLKKSSVSNQRARKSFPGSGGAVRGGGHHPQVTATASTAATGMMIPMSGKTSSMMTIIPKASAPQSNSPILLQQHGGMSLGDSSVVVLPVSSSERKPSVATVSSCCPTVASSVLSITRPIPSSERSQPKVIMASDIPTAVLHRIASSSFGSVRNAMSVVRPVSEPVTVVPTSAPRRLPVLGNGGSSSTSAATSAACNSLPEDVDVIIIDEGGVESVPTVPSATVTRGGASNGGSTTTTTTSSSSNALPRTVSRPNHTMPVLFPRPATEEGPDVPGRSVLLTDLLDDYASQVADHSRTLFERTISKFVKSGAPEAQVLELTRQLEQERQQHHQELERMKRLHAAQIYRTKKLLWCRRCMLEANFYCCWNTAYCTQHCQSEHWQEHQSTCQQVNRARGSRSAPSPQHPATASAPAIQVATAAAVTAGGRTTVFPSASYNQPSASPRQRKAHSRQRSLGGPSTSSSSFSRSSPSSTVHGAGGYPAEQTVPNGVGITTTVAAPRAVIPPTVPAGPVPRLLPPVSAPGGGTSGGQLLYPTATPRILNVFGHATNLNSLSYTTSAVYGAGSGSGGGAGSRSGTEGAGLANARRPQGPPPTTSNAGRGDRPSVTGGDSNNGETQLPLSGHQHPVASSVSSGSTSGNGNSCSTSVGHDSPVGRMISTAPSLSTVTVQTAALAGRGRTSTMNRLGAQPTSTPTSVWSQIIVQSTAAANGGVSFVGPSAFAEVGPRGNGGGSVSAGAPSCTGGTPMHNSSIPHAAGDAVAFSRGDLTIRRHGR